MSVPRTGRRSNKNNENDLAKLHAKIALQGLTNAVLTLPCKICGDSCARIFAMAFRKSAVSWDQRPPTLAAKTTKQALPPSPESSGWFPSPYELPAKPHRSWWLRAVVQCSRHAGVTPDWCLRPTVPAPTMTSMRRPSNGLKNSNIQLTDEPVQTHTSDCSRTLEQPPAPQGNLCNPTPQPSNTLHDGGHTCRVRGHIGKCERTMGAGERGACTTTPRMVVGRCESHGWWAMLSVLLKPTGPVVISSTRRVCQGGPSSLAQTFQQCCPCRTLPAALHWLSYPGRPLLLTETPANFVQQPERVPQLWMGSCYRQDQLTVLRESPT